MMMRMILAGLGLFLCAGCVTDVQRPLKTEVVTFPPGGIIEVNGQRMASGPATITLPQNDLGQLTGEVQLKAYPPGEGLVSATKTISPNTYPSYTNRVPARILIDLTHAEADTNRVDLLQWQYKQRDLARARAAREHRSKPTRPVGEYSSGAMTKKPTRHY